MKRKNKVTHKMPLVEKKRLKFRYIIYICIAMLCIIAIGIAVYIQFYKDEKLSVIFGITNEDSDEIITLKDNFFNIFDNSLCVINNYSGSIDKINGNQGLIVTSENVNENQENYSLDVKVPHFNINSSVAIGLNNEIDSTFKGKYESVKDKDTDGTKVIFNVKYKAYLYNNILSLIVMSELKEGNNSERIIMQSYNYNIYDKAECSVYDIMNVKELNEKYVNSKIESEIKSSQEENEKLKSLGYDVNVRNEKSSIYDIKNADVFFIGENSHMYVVYAYGNSEFTSELNVIIF